MKTFWKRLLAVSLSAALLIGCAVSGLVLPAAAATMDGNLFPDGDLEGTLTGNWETDTTALNDTAGFGGGTAWAVKASSTTLPAVTLSQSLKPDKAYVFRCKQTGGSGKLYFSETGYTNVATYEYPMTSATGAWSEAIVPFKVNSETTTLPKITFYNSNSKPSEDIVYYDDFAVYEYVPGMNLMPGGDGTAVPVTRNSATNNVLGAFNSYFSLATDGDNAVWKFSGLNASGTSANLKDSYICKLISAGTDVVFSFRYKGDGANVTITAGSSSSAVVGQPVIGEKDGWKTYKTTINVKTINVNYLFKLNFSGATEVLVDDFTIAEYVEEPVTATVDIEQSTATVEEGATVTLKATATPEGTPITWTSSDNDTATVVDGVVSGIKAGTVTITATVDGGASDTCEVTVTAKEVTPPAGPSDGNLFPDGDLEGTLIGNWEADTTKALLNATAGFGGGTAWEVKSGYGSLPAMDLSQPLEPDKFYVFRCKVKGAASKISFEYVSYYTNMATANLVTAANGDWSEVFALFKVGSTRKQFTGVRFYNTNTDGASVYYDDIGVYEYTDGMNLMPGSDGATIPATYNSATTHAMSKFANYMSLATDGTNKVWKFTGLNAATGTKAAVDLRYLNKLVVAEDVAVISFRYKGTGAEVIIGHHDSSYATVLDSNTSASDDGWVTYTATVKFLKVAASSSISLQFSGAAEVLVDDFSIVKYVEEPLEDLSIEMLGLGIHWPQGVEAIKANADGVRFGARLYFGEGFPTLNEETGMLQLPYGGEYCDVVSVGTLLRRHADGDLTVANATWKSEAYSSTTNKFKCIQKTDTYLDFAVNMMAGENVSTADFNARNYDARGYVQLSNGEIIYTDVVTNGIDAYFATQQ